MTKIIFGIFTGILLLFAAIIPATGELPTLKINNDIENNNVVMGEYPLPPPISIDMVLEESICRRMSVRSFTGEAAHLKGWQ